MIKKTMVKYKFFTKSNKTNSSAGDSGANTIPPIGDAFMYIGTSSKNHGIDVFVSFERTDTIQNTNITFYYNRLSILTNDSTKSMGKTYIQLLFEDKTWKTRYNIPKNDRYSDSSTQWTKLSLNFTVGNYGIGLIYDELDSSHADLCFMKKTVTPSVY